MKKTLRSALVASSLALLAPSLAAAQTPPEPPPPPPPAEPTTLQCEACQPSAEDQRVIDEASDLIARGRAADAQRVLRPRLAGQSPWARPYGSLSVLDRLATRLATAPSTSTSALAPAEDPNQPRGGVEAAGLYASAITFGIGTGVWLDVMLDVEDIRLAVIAPLVLGGAGAGLLFLAEHNSGPIRRGRGTAMSNGYALGIVGGLLLGVYGGDELRWSARAVATSIWGGAALGAGLGYGLGALAEVRPASASFVGSGGLWGAVFGMTVAGLVDADGDDVPIAGMVGEVVGAGAAAALAGVLRPAEAQVRWMDLGVFSGGLLGVGVAVLIFGEDRYSTLVGPALCVEAGMVAGGVLGYVLGRPRADAPARTASASSRFAAVPSIAPLPGGAQATLSLPNLL